MKEKLICYWKKQKIVWICMLVVIFVVAVAYSQMVKAQHGTDTVSSGTSYPANGYWTGVSVEGPWGTSTIYFTVTTDKKYSGSTFNDASRPLSIHIQQTNDNPYGMQILDTSPSTDLNATKKNYSWFNLKIGYTVPAHYYHSGEYFDTPSVTWQAHEVSNKAWHSREDHWVETTIRMSAYDTAVATYYDPSSKNYYRYHDCHATIYLWGRDKHRVYYDANGGDGGGFSWEFNDGDMFTFPTVSRRGYTFSKWVDQATGWDSGDWWVVCSSDFTEIAQWTANTYTVSYDGNHEDSGWTSDGTATYDQNFTFADNGYTRKGYSFVGWSTNKNATTAEYLPGQTIYWQQTDRMELYAIWGKSSYDISFDGNGASGSKKTASMKYGKDDNLPANSFQRAGYTFIGWSEDPEAIKPKYTDGQMVNTLCDAGETYELYAIWKKSDGSFDLHNLIRDDAMFQGDVEIEGQNKTGFSRDHIDSEYGRIDKPEKPGYFTDRYK